MNLFRRHDSSRSPAYRHTAPLVIRWATPDDAERLGMLAELDEAPVPPAPLLAGWVGDELWVAVSLSTGATISDPFKPSAEVAALVTHRGRQLIVPGRRSRAALRRLRRRESSLGLAARLSGLQP